MKSPIKLSDVTGIKPDTRTHNPTTAVVLPRCSIGIEVELENVTAINSATPNLDLWQVVSDGSLRNNGIEFISKVIRGADIVEALDQLTLALAKHNPDFSASARTSVHIHIDVRNYDVQQLINLCIVYSIFEKSLFRYVGIDRADNNFCVPFYQADGVVNLITMLTKKDTGYISVGLETPKYTALNLAPTRSQGSVEFRQHYGCADKVRLLQWINILLSLKRFVNNYRNDPQDIIDSVCSNGEDLFKDVFRGTLDPYDRDLMSKDMLNGARIAQEMLYRFNSKTHNEKLGSREISASNSLLHKIYKINGKLTSGKKKMYAGAYVPNMFETTLTPEQINNASARFTGDRTNALGRARVVRSRLEEVPISINEITDDEDE